MIKNQDGQTIGAQMVSTAGAAFTGAVTVYVTGDAGVQAIGSVGAGVCTHEGNGYHTYRPAAAETAYDLIGFTFIGAGAIPQTVQIATITPAQIAALQSTSGLTSTFIQDLLLDAAIEVSAGRAGGKLEPGVAAWMLRKLNRLLDLWNVTPGANFSTGFASYTPTASHAPHTYGPAAGANWALTTARPNRLLGANLILNTVTPNVRVPIRIRDEGWWLEQAVQALASAIVTDVYYEPAWPNANVWLWPVPTATYPIELLTDQAFNAYGPADTLYLPCGYPQAIVYTLAEECAGGLGQEVTPKLEKLASDARVMVFGANVARPGNARTRDAGMPGGARGRGYNYRTGRIENL